MHNELPKCNNLETEKAVLPYYDLNGGTAHMAVIAQGPEVKTTKCAQPQSHGKQTNAKQHAHNRGMICDIRSSVPQVKRQAALLCMWDK